MANSVDPDQTAPIGAVCSGSTLIASILYSSVMLGNYLQQTTQADDIFRYIFLGALRVNYSTMPRRCIISLWQELYKSLGNVLQRVSVIEMFSSFKSFS